MAIFTTTGNLGVDDVNREGVDPDVYYAVPTGVFTLRVRLFCTPVPQLMARPRSALTLCPSRTGTLTAGAS